MTKEKWLDNIVRLDFRFSRLSGVHFFTLRWRIASSFPKQGLVIKAMVPFIVPLILTQTILKKTHLTFVVGIFFFFFFSSGSALLDLMIRCDEVAPSPGKRVLCRHPFDEAKRAYVCPSHVEPLYHVYWKDGMVRFCINNLLTESEVFYGNISNRDLVVFTER